MSATMSDVQKMQEELQGGSFGSYMIH